MLKSVFAPHLGHNVKFGRLAPKSCAPKSLRFAKYAAKNPAPPATLDLTPAASASLRNIYLNDNLGDCVIAGGYHEVGVATGNAGQTFVATNAQIIADYSAIGGYVPGRPGTDNGCDLQTAMKYWQSHGFANGTKLAGWLAVDPTNQTELMQALWLFETLYFGESMPDAWVNTMPVKDGFVWDVAGSPDDSNGHCFVGVGYNAQGVIIDTWALYGVHTWAAIAKYAAASSQGELYVLLTPDIINKAQAKAPNGFDWAALVADFDALGGSVPTPTPTPTPTATTYTLVGPTQATVGLPFAVTVTPNAAYTGTITVIPSGAASTGLAAATLSWSGGSAPQSVTFVATTGGPLSMTGSNGGGLTDAAAITIVVNATPAPPTPGPAGPGHAVAIAIDPTLSTGLTLQGTYYSINNHNRPKGTPISLTYGGRLILSGVLVPSSSL